MVNQKCCLRFPLPVYHTDQRVDMEEFLVSSETRLTKQTKEIHRQGKRDPGSAQCLVENELLCRESV